MADQDGADKDGADEEGALQRWSRRKAQSRQVQPRQAEAQPAPVEPAEPEPIDPANLPDIETLDASSDFTVFMREGVPEQLRRLALRKLWRLDPVLANVDGLVDYGEDFTDAADLIEGVKSAYQVGKGYVTDDARPEPETTPQPPEAVVEEDETAAADAAEDEQTG